jgi:ABC-type nitrate/sulfonate/bicarbonate transport system substrate-binding protein
LLAGCASPTPAAAPQPPATQAVQNAAPAPTAAGAPSGVRAYTPGPPLTPPLHVKAIEVQFYIAVPDPVIFNALNRGVDIRVLVSSTTNKPDDRPAGFMVRSELLDSGQVKSLADLRGRPVSVANPSSQFSSARWRRVA